MCTFVCTLGPFGGHFLVRLPEFAAFQHDPQHGVGIGLLVNEAQSVGICPSTRRRYISVGHVLALRGPLAPVGVPQASVELF